MNWNEIGTELFLGVIGLLLSTFGLIITYLINKYIKNDKLKTTIASLNELVQACVKEIYQVYVEELKKKDMFDKEAQQKALDMCIDKIEKEMTQDIRQWLNENFGDTRAYLTTLVESSVASLNLTRK